MASLSNAALCAVVATVFWSLIGYALGCRLLPRALAATAAPVLGWAVYSAVTLPLFELTGFSRATVIGFDAICMAVSAASLWQRRPALIRPAPALTLSYLAAAILALAPTSAIVPKYAADGGIYFAAPIFDHSKIAIIDAMARQGLPPVNPVFGAFGTAGQLAYYYLWHFSAAQLELALGVSGWEADIGQTWFTAFASLCLMMGLAIWLGRDARAAIIAVLLAAAASARTVLGWLFHSEGLTPFLAFPNGFAGWLFQSAWVPQHLMAAACTVLAMVLMVRYAYRPSVALLLTLVLTIAASFESSTFVGGVTFAVAAVAAVPLVLFRLDRPRRLPFLAGMIVAAVLVACLVAPFVVAQLATVLARHDPTPIVIRPFAVLGELFPEPLRRILDLPAYWLVELPLEFPAVYLGGTIAFVVAIRAVMARRRKTAVAALACLAGAGLVVPWLFASTLGDLNDLAMRAVLPAATILIAGAAAGAVRSPRRALIAAVALGGLALSLPDTVKLVASQIGGDAVPDRKIFAQSPELWAAVRRYSGTADRIANNPLFLQDMTPWPVNLSWALLADRSSCFAGRELALAFAPLPAAQREAINAQFIRVFSGEGTTEDVDDMATKYGCNVVVITAQDGAWSKDLFAASTDYRLADDNDGKWRIYVRAAIAQR